MRALFALLACVCLCVVGCSSGSPTFKVSGTLQNDGKPYTAPKGSSVLITFVPVELKNMQVDTYPTKMKAEDSSFLVPGREGNGIPPGKYRVALQQMVPGGSDEINAMNERFSSTKSPIIVEVKDATPIVIDIAKAPAN